MPEAAIHIQLLNNLTPSDRSFFQNSFLAHLGESQQFFHMTYTSERWGTIKGRNAGNHCSSRNIVIIVQCYVFGQIGQF